MAFQIAIFQSYGKYTLRDYTVKNCIQNRPLGYALHCIYISTYIYVSFFNK